MFAKISAFFLSVYMFILGLFGLGVKLPESNDKQAVIKLTANPSTGYTWEYVIEDESVVTLTDNTYGESKSKLDGASVQQYFTFEGLKEGTTTVTFSYLRPWEDSLPAQVITYSFTVDADKNISFVQIDNE